MDIPCLVLIKILKDFPQDEIIECLLDLLAKIHDPKKTIGHHKIYELINKVVDYFPQHIQWIEDFIFIIKYFAPDSSYKIMMVISAHKDNFPNKIYSNDHLSIFVKEKNIQIIVQDHSLIEGYKYLYDGNVLDESLKSALDNVKENIVNELIG